MKMRTLKSRLMAGLLCLVMVLTLLPASALAVGEDEAASTTQTGDMDGAYTEPEPFDPTDPDAADTVQAMIDALPDADDAADMTAEELEVTYLQAADAYTAFEQLDEEAMLSITGLEKLAELMDALTAATAALANNDQTSGIFKFTANEDGTGFVITGLTDEGKAANTLTIPETLTGDVIIKDSEDNSTTVATGATLPVTELRSLFSMHAQATSVTLSSNLRVIGNGAFSCHDTLTLDITTVTIPADSQLERIGSSAFYHMTSLTRIGIGDGITLPATLTTIGGSAFAGCTGLTSFGFEGSQLKTLGSSAFSETGLVNVNLPDTVETFSHGVFSECDSLKTVSVSENLEDMGLGTFEDCKALESVTFRGRYLENGWNGGYSRFLTFHDINPDCVVTVPRPQSETAYKNVINAVYAEWLGRAPVSVKLKWADGTAATAPGAPAVTQASLNALSGLRGIAVDTTSAASDIGCAAIITISEGSGATANLMAALSGDGTVCWETVEAFTSDTAGAYTGGPELTQDMYHHVYRVPQDDANATIALDTTGRSGKTVFYFPIATKYGSYNGAPDTSTVGQPVKVQYIPDQASVKIYNSRDYLYYGLELPESDPSATVNDTNESVNGNTYNKQKAMKAEVVVPSFESVLSGSLVVDSTVANRDANNYIQYQWYTSDTQEHTNETAIGDPGYAVFAGNGVNGELLWRIGRPTNAQLQAALHMGPQFLYAKITVSINNNQTSIYTDDTAFWRYDPETFKLRLLDTNDWNYTTMIIGSTTYNSYEAASQNPNFDYQKVFRENGVSRGANRIFTVAVDERGLDAATKAAYNRLLDASYAYTRASISYGIHKAGADGNVIESVHYYDGNVKFTGRSFAAPTDVLGTEQRSQLIRYVQMGYSSGVSVFLDFGRAAGKSFSTNFGLPQYRYNWAGSQSAGGGVVSYEYINDDADLWKTEGDLENNIRTDFKGFHIYIKDSFSSQWMAGLNDGNGNYTAELWRVDAADQNRGGTLALTLNRGRSDTDVDDNDYDWAFDAVTSGTGSPYINRLDSASLDAVNQPGMNYYYWKIYQKGYPGAADYSPTFVRFQPRGLAGSATVSTDRTKVYLNDTATLNFTLGGVNIHRERLLNTSYLKLQYKQGDQWKDVTFRGDTLKNTAAYYDPDAVTEVNQLISGALQTTLTVPFQLRETYYNSTTYTDENKLHFFDQYGADGTVTLRLAWIGRNTQKDSQYAGVYATSDEITVEQTTLQPVPMTTTVKLGTETLTGSRFNRVTEYETDEDGKEVKDEDGNRIPTGDPMTFTTVATGTAAPTITWTVKENGTVKGTLASDATINPANKPKLTLSNTVLTLDSVTTASGSTTMVLSLTAPTNGSSATIVLTPEATIGTSARTAGADYVVSINPRARAETPGIPDQPKSMTFKPGTDLTGKTLTATGWVGSGSLSWQWYRCTGSSVASQSAATPIAGANGSGGNAVFNLPTSLSANVGVHYYFCRFTNRDPAATRTTVATRDTDLVQVNITDQAVEVSAPIINAAVKEYSFHYGRLSELDDSATTLYVQKPEALQGAEPDWVTFPTPKQSVYLTAYIEKKDAEGNWVAANMQNSSNLWVSRLVDTVEETNDGALAYTVDDNYLRLRSSLNKTLSSYGIKYGDPVRFKLVWEVTHTLEMSENATFRYPSNLAGETTAVSTETIYIERIPVPAPTFGQYEVPKADGGSCTLDFGLEDGVKIKEILPSVTLGDETYTNVPVIEMAKDAGSAATRQLTLLPQHSTGTVRISWSVDWWDYYGNGTWGGTGGTGAPGTAVTRNLGYGISSNHSGTPPEITYVSCVLTAWENGDPSYPSKTVRSGILGIRWVDLVDAQTPAASSALDTANKAWYHGGVTTDSLTLGATTDGSAPWSVTDDGQLTYQWRYSYIDFTKTDPPHESGTLAGQTGPTLTLSKDDQLVKDYLASAAAYNAKYGTYMMDTYWYLDVTNTNSGVSGDRTVTKTQQFVVLFTESAMRPSVTCAPLSKTEFSTGEEIELSVTVNNETELAAAGNQLSYQWYWQPVSITGMTDSTQNRTFADNAVSMNNGFNSYGTKASTKLITMPQSMALNWGTGTDTIYFSLAWWTTNPNAVVKLRLYCEVTSRKGNLESQSVSTDPLIVTLTRPTFNNGLTVKTYAENGTTPLYTYTDPTTAVVVPTNGRVVFSMADTTKLYLGSSYWRRQIVGQEGLASGAQMGETQEWTVNYSDLCDSSGTFQPSDVWAQVRYAPNTDWYMDTVKVRLVSNDVAVPEVTLNDKFINAGDGTNLSALPGNATALTGTVSYQWFMREHGSTGDWTELTSYTTSTLNVTMNNAGVAMDFQVIVTHTKDGEASSTTKTCTVTTRKLTIHLPETMPPAYTGRVYEASPLTVDWIGETGVTFDWTAPTGYNVGVIPTGSGVQYGLSSPNPTTLTNADLTVTAKKDGVTLGTATVQLNITVSEPPAGVKVSGQVKSYNPKNATTITLKQDGEVKYTATIDAETTGSGQVTQSFEFEGVAAGTYDLVVTKSCHLTYTIQNVVVGTTDLNLAADSTKPYSTITLLAGDVNRDGTINSLDLNMVWRSTNYLKSVSASGVATITDINGDETINSLDLNIIWRTENYLKSSTTHCQYSYI